MKECICDTLIDGEICPAQTHKCVCETDKKCISYHHMCMCETNKKCLVHISESE